ncbi:MAG: hypothetical protein K2L07_16675 [Lachnospiraceae bacterium]|nr:hypothetical protein [Lachnospiraceae bacterium]
MDEMLEYIRIYADSVETDYEKDIRSKKAMELYKYLYNNREGLMPYRKQNIKLPKLSDGMRYGNMGVQENQNCTVITMRMKGNRYTEESAFNIRMTEIITTLSAAKTPKKDGKGNPYVDEINMHIPLRDAIQTASRRAFAKKLL